jgi:tRNA A58 N-methylase Trm61
LFLVQKAGKVYGVEIVPEAIEDACANDELKMLTNVEFEVGAAEDVIPNWAEQGIKTDVIVVDPPRDYDCNLSALSMSHVTQPLWPVTSRSWRLVFPNPRSSTGGYVSADDA